MSNVASCCQRVILSYRQLVPLRHRLTLQYIFRAFSNWVIYLVYLTRILYTRGLFHCLPLTGWAPPRIFPTSDCTAAQRASTTNLNLQPSGAILYCSIPCRLIFLFQYCSLAVRCVYEVPLPPPTVVAVLSFISVSSGSEQVVFGFQVFVVRFHIIHSPLFNISKASCSGKQPYCIAWISICICYTRFYKALDLQDIDRIDRDLRGWFQPYMA